MSENYYQKHRKLSFTIIMITLLLMISVLFILAFTNIYVDVPGEINDKVLKTTGLTCLLTAVFAGGRAMYYDV